MSTLQLFHILVAGHIATGLVGLLSFWVPIAARKGGPRHRWWGRVFVRSLLATGVFAVGISLVTLSDPVGTHPKLAEHPELSDPIIIAAIFGWMMLYLAVLTINLAWYGSECIKHRRAHALHRQWYNLLSQLLLLIAALLVVYQGWQARQPLMLGISMVGFATVGTNLYFMFSRSSPRNAWQFEHLKGLIGAGISVYTAFFAFGAVRFYPELALYPGYWAIPLVVGLALIIRYRLQLLSA
jgi:hypothetical protein